MKNIFEINNTVNRPERAIQFGEGGFLRGFVDWMLQKLNDNGKFNGNVVVVQPIENGMCDMLTKQNCLYTHIIRGSEGVEKTVIDTISRFSVSKFKVRVLPSILEYIKRYDKMPETLIEAFANLIKLYKTDLTNDDKDVFEFMKDADLKSILEKVEYWGEDLSFMYEEVKKYVDQPT